MIRKPVSIERQGDDSCILRDRDWRIIAMHLKYRDALEIKKLLNGSDKMGEKGQ